MESKSTPSIQTTQQPTDNDSNSLKPTEDIQCDNDQLVNDTILSPTEASFFSCGWISEPANQTKCNLEFQTGEALYEHMCERHVGRKALGNLCTTCKWSDCNRSFSKRDHIISHLRVHVDFRPYQCKECNRSWKRSQDYKKHVQQKHTIVDGVVKETTSSKNSLKQETPRKSTDMIFVQETVGIDGMTSTSTISSTPTRRATIPTPPSSTSSTPVSYAFPMFFPNTPSNPQFMSNHVSDQLARLSALQISESMALPSPTTSLSTPTSIPSLASPSPSSTPSSSSPPMTPNMLMDSANFPMNLNVRRMRGHQRSRSDSAFAFLHRHHQQQQQQQQQFAQMPSSGFAPDLSNMVASMNLLQPQPMQHHQYHQLLQQQAPLQQQQQFGSEFTVPMDPALMMQHPLPQHPPFRGHHRRTSSGTKRTMAYLDATNSLEHQHQQQAKKRMIAEPDLEEIHEMLFPSSKPVLPMTNPSPMQSRIIHHGRSRSLQFDPRNYADLSHVRIQPSPPTMMNMNSPSPLGSFQTDSIVHPTPQFQQQQQQLVKQEQLQLEQQQQQSQQSQSDLLMAQLEKIVADSISMSNDIKNMEPIMVKMEEPEDEGNGTGISGDRNGDGNGAVNGNNIALTLDDLLVNYSTMQE